MRFRGFCVALLLACAACSSRGGGAPTAVEQMARDLRAASLQGEPPAALKEQLKQQGDAAIDALSPLLSDADPRVAAAAVDVLQEIGTERALDRIVGWAILRLDDPTHRTKLPGPGWRRLLDVGKAALPALSRAYSSELPQSTRLAMVSLVYTINDKAGQPLLDAALKDKDPQIVATALEALGRVRGDAAYERLVKSLESDDVQIRAGALRGFAHLGDPRAVEPLLGVLLSPDQPIPYPGPSAPGASETLHSKAAFTIDALTGADLGGDPAKVRIWLDQHGRRERAPAPARTGDPERR